MEIKVGSAEDISIASLTLSDVSNAGSCEDMLKCDCTDSEAGSRSSSVSTTSTVPFIKQWPKCCMKQRNNAILKSKRFCDATFIIGKGEHKQKFLAHKAFLSLGSDVFDAMFCDNWSSASEIEIPDVEPSAFADLLSYLYIDEVSLTVETVGATLYAAKKYAIVPLEKRCIEYLMECLCAENSFAVLSHARLFDEKKLTDSCLKVIDEDTSAAVLGTGFLEINSSLLRMVLERDSLNIQEVELFEAVLRWCSAECTRRSLPVSPESQQLVLKEILPLIRFPLMSPEELLFKVVPASVLTHEELISVNHFLSPDPKPCVNFNNLPRFWQSFKICRFQEIGMPFRYHESPETGASIAFKVDREVRFSGVGLYGPVSVPAQYSITLELSRASPLELICKKSSVHAFNNFALVFEELFQEPIKLEPGINYELWVAIQGPPSIYGKKGVENVTKTLSHERTVTVSFASARTTSNAQTSVDKGQIPELIFTT